MGANRERSSTIQKIYKTSANVLGRQYHATRTAADEHLSCSLPENLLSWVYLFGYWLILIEGIEDTGNGAKTGVEYVAVTKQCYKGSGLNR
jgi:hypothetical protein